MSRIVVKISVEIEGSGVTGNGTYPANLAWEHEVRCSDSAAWYGDTVQRAVRVTARRAVESVRPFVREGGVPDAGD